MTQHQCSAALFRAKCSPHCSVLLCNEGSRQAVCHCSHTCGDLLFIQVCSDPAQMQCSSVQGKNAFPTIQCCSAVKVHSRQCVTAVTPVGVCCSCRGRVTQHKCTAELSTANCSAHCSVLPCKTALQQAVCYCSFEHGDLFFMQVCSDPTPNHCSKVQGKMHSPLFKAALQ